eukprot:TRINITY_DN24670_c0_g1_i1.p1 TRINITY_DN24670_c0_g1~~TRINITY_DN24670_c0_g1_i1.p1  ORF type:complete len:312 (+),score=41.94 TRINITY_DN24670_c0_g1_i1:56-937(+)
MNQTDAMWVYRAACLLIIAITYVIAFSEGNRTELRDSVNWHSSPIDWCEVNYEFNENVVEFWNTISGLVIIPIAGLAWVLHSRMRRRVEPRFAFCLTTLTLVGLGSLYFHATLSKLGQVLDEITICWTNYYAILLVVPKTRLEETIGVTARFLVFSPETLITVVLITPIWGLFYPIISHILTVATIILLPWAILRQFRSTSKADPASITVLKTALSFHGTAVFCWVCDRLFCHEITALFGVYPQLHAWWHVFVFLGAYFTIVGITWVRSTGDGYEATIRHYYGVLPYTHIQEL